MFSKLQTIVQDRIDNPKEGSYTNRLLDDHEESLDLAADLAQPLPIAVLGQLLGCRFRRLRAFS